MNTTGPGQPLPLVPYRVGRRLSAERLVRISDVDPRGRFRLDAIARFMQDIANDDSMGAGFTDEAAMAWVVRRTVIEQHRAGQRREAVTASTWCSGLGRRWAERRTSLVGDAGLTVEAASIWVHVDPATGAPERFPDAFLELYGPSAEGRKVSSKLHHPSEPPAIGDTAAASTSTSPWELRRTDLDPWNHVNNAATWAIVEEFGRATLRSPRFRAELEYRAGLTGPEPAIVTVYTATTDSANAPEVTLWIHDGADRTLAATARLTPLVRDGLTEPD